jgi:hypothetical protein
VVELEAMQVVAAAATKSQA